MKRPGSWANSNANASPSKQSAGGKQTLWQEIKEALSKKETYLLSGIYLAVVIGYYGLTFFIPAITAKMEGRSKGEQTLIATLPYIFGLITMLWNAKHSDQTGERRFHTVWSLFLGAAALGISVMWGENLIVAVVCLCLVGIGVHAYLPVFWTWPSAFMTSAVAATAVGLINSVGNLGRYFGPQVVGQLKKETGSYTPGLKFLAVSILVSGILAMFLKLPEKKEH